jgi:betaine-aldehyde dehydrogenase
MSTSVDDTGQRFVNGSRRRGGVSEPYAVTSPSNRDLLATDSFASPDDVDDAVTAAKVAFPGWAGATQVKHVMSALVGEPRKYWHDNVFTG